MPTPREHTHTQDGPVDLRLEGESVAFRVVAVDGLSRATVTVQTDDADGPAVTAVEGTEMTSDGDVLRVTVPPLRGGGGVNISGGDIHVSTGRSVVGMQIGMVGGSGIVVQNGRVVVGGGNSVTSTGVQVTVRVPVKSAVIVTTVNGSFHAVGPLGAVEADTVNGSITVEFAVTVNAESSNGSIRVSDCQRVQANTSNGSIKVARVAQRIDARSSNGSIKITQLPPSCVVKARASNGSIACPSGVSADVRSVFGRVDRSEAVRPS